MILKRISDKLEDMVLSFLTPKDLAQVFSTKKEYTQNLKPLALQSFILDFDHLMQEAFVIHSLSRDADMQMPTIFGTVEVEISGIMRKIERLVNEMLDHQQFHNTQDEYEESIRLMNELKNHIWRTPWGRIRVIIPPEVDQFIRTLQRQYMPR